MSDIKFSKNEKDILIQKVKMYFFEELDQEIGGFDAEFLIDFFSQEIGAYFYNRGLYDAQALIANKVDEISESLYELEKPTEFTK
ncbi:DUF2164 domain-containing protein [Endozoicomonas sp. SM1973]|uniref:DUF2164 domain-containing protein n=1 Tax=Spartinivicinus marinus TaxID=2994442 RepID=A0A853HUL2_9GAMM|nr:DUF2164 domain-containing protein [Spartinivicinus marinus]MCX4029378.1 DUF2164 domain-containing protein [Spartinivicinus marinus]NYZ64953.1 DUF2164 domain-containing protein [Spartinivicinus marinus]